VGKADVAKIKSFGYMQSHLMCVSQFIQRTFSKFVELKNQAKQSKVKQKEIKSLPAYLAAVLDLQKCPNLSCDQQEALYICLFDILTGGRINSIINLVFPAVSIESKDVRNVAVTETKQGKIV
jgi:hypothetical protein